MYTIAFARQVSRIASLSIEIERRELIDAMTSESATTRMPSGPAEAAVPCASSRRGWRPFRPPGQGKYLFFNLKVADECTSCRALDEPLASKKMLRSTALNYDAVA
jgi:hypothetical protein